MAVHSRRPVRRASVLAVGALLVLGVGTACTSSSSSPPAKRYPVWSSGWRPGDVSHLAGYTGTFYAALTNGRACAWLGTPQPVRWPQGWTVSFGPTVLRDATGRIVAHEGDNVTVGGGLSGTTATSANPCGPVGGDIFDVESNISENPPSGH